MDKLVTGPEGAGVVDIRQPVGENIRALARAKGKDVADVQVAVLDRPRHEGLVAAIREAGAGTRLLLDGDVAGGINAALPDTRIDMCVGVGGSPEGVVTACAIKALGGFVQGRLVPGDDAERERGEAAGLRMDHVYSADELVAGDNTFFVATGVTDGGLLEGVRRRGGVVRTESVVLRSRSGTVRRIVAEHLAEKWL
jgi:fructose-1,6-bisphosphatase II